MPGGPKKGPKGKKRRTKTRESKTETAPKTEFYSLRAFKKLIPGGKPEVLGSFSATC
jgi:hypothetical protein